MIHPPELAVALSECGNHTTLINLWMLKSHPEL
jgi:hypothetical protein